MEAPQRAVGSTLAVTMYGHTHSKSIHQTDKGSVEELRRALEASQAETAALRVAAEGADRALRVNDTDDADEADSAH